jgi:hypothetical protein
MYVYECGPLSWHFHSAKLSELNAECHYTGRTARINPLKTKRRLLNLKAQSVPRCKHFSSRL